MSEMIEAAIIIAAVFAGIVIAFVILVGWIIEHDIKKLAKKELPQEQKDRIKQLVDESYERAVARDLRLERRTSADE